MKDKPLVWLHGEVKTPPCNDKARVEAGHWLRIRDENINWRIIYRIDPDAIVIVNVFKKKTQKTPRRIIDRCKERLKQYDLSH